MAHENYFLSHFLVESEVNVLEQFYQLGWTLDSAGGASGEAYMAEQDGQKLFLNEIQILLLLRYLQKELYLNLFGRNVLKQVK